MLVHQNFSGVTSVFICVVHKNKLYTVLANFAAELVKCWWSGSIAGNAGRTSSERYVYFVLWKYVCTHRHWPEIFIVVYGVEVDGSCGEFIRSILYLVCCAHMYKYSTLSVNKWMRMCECERDPPRFYFSTNFTTCARLVSQLNLVFFYLSSLDSTYYFFFFFIIFFTFWPLFHSKEYKSQRWEH